MNKEYNLTDKEMEGLQNIVTDTLASKCKNCVFCTWACPGWMCMNKEHPDFDLDDDCPTTVNLDDDGCKLFCLSKYFEVTTMQKPQEIKCTKSLTSASA